MRGLLALLQLSDSALPAGGFAHSDGVESLGAGRLPDVLAAHGRLSVGPADGWLVRRAHRAVAARCAAGLRGTAGDDVASRPARLQREGSLALGGGLLRVADEVAGGAELRWVAAALGDLTPRATAFGAVARVLGVEEREAAAGFAYVTLAGMVSAAVRLRAFGAMEGQRRLARALDAVGELGDDPEWGSGSPLLEIAMMRHETLAPRQFAS